MEISLSNKERVQLLTQARTLEAIIDWIEKIIKTNTPNIYTPFANSESMSWQCAVSIIGNAAATIGLAACAETAGIGCAAAAVGKIASRVLTVDTCKESQEEQLESQEERKNRINQLIRKISHD